MSQARRRTDGGILCILAIRATQVFDWWDRRQVDAYLFSLAILYGTVEVTSWAMNFADLHPDKPGIDIAAIIGAVAAPYMALQAVVIKWLFEARQKSFLPENKQ